MNATTVKVENGTITKSATISEDPKRDGLLIARCYDDKGKQLATVWGKKNQSYIQEFIAGA